MNSIKHRSFFNTDGMDFVTHFKNFTELLPHGPSISEKGGKVTVYNCKVITIGIRGLTRSIF